MKNQHSVTIVSLMMLIVLFDFGCNSARQSNSEKSKTPINAKTKITKDSLKAGLSGEKVKFFDYNPDDISLVERSMPKLKIVSAENPPKVEWNREVYEFSQLPTKLRDFFGIYGGKSVALAASESDIAFYNKEGISVENFELLIRNLDEEVNEFYIDFVEIQIPDKISPKSKKTIDFSNPKLEAPKDDEPPPPLRKSTPK